MIVLKWLKRQLMLMMIMIQRWARKKGFRAAVANAQQMTDTTGKTSLIFFIEGQYEVFYKQDLTRLRNRGKAFRGMSNEQIENMAELKIYKHGKVKEAIC